MIVNDIQNIYKTYFNKPYSVSKENNTAGNEVASYRLPEGCESQFFNNKQGFYDRYLGRDVFLPVTLSTVEKEIYIPCVTINATRKNTIIRTAVAEREGTVKEQFSTGDWVFNLKGVLIGEDGAFPQEDIEILVELSKNKQPLELKCGYTDLFFPGESKVVIESIEFPETQGKSMRHRPFTMTLESDFIDTLIYEISA
jgi:hypothetical protein